MAKKTTDPVADENAAAAAAVKAGDKVNYTGNGPNDVIGAELISIKPNGLASLKLATEKQQVVTNVPHRAAERLARGWKANTWHAIAAALALLLALVIAPASAQAATDDYTMLSATGSTVARVVQPGSSTGPIRLVSLDVTGDNATNEFVVRRAVTPLTILSNQLSTATNFYAADYQIPINSVIVIQSGTSAVFATVNSTNTGLYGLSGQIGIAVTAGEANAWLLETAFKTTIGNATVRRDSEAIAWNYKRRPMVVEATGTSACRINFAVFAKD